MNAQPLNNGRDRLDRAELDKEVFITCNGPRLFEMDPFISKCYNVFLSSYRPPLIQNTKYETSRVIDRLKKETSWFSWNELL